MFKKTLKSRVTLGDGTTLTVVEAYRTGRVKLAREHQYMFGRRVGYLWPDFRVAYDASVDPLAAQLGKTKWRLTQQAYDALERSASLTSA